MIMHAKKPILITDDWQIQQELRNLGLTADIVAAIARACASGRAEALGVDPVSAPGTLAYIQGVRTVRLQLLPHGWRMSRTGNVESTVNDELGIQLCFQNVDMACTDRNPQAISGKGSGSRQLILDGQGELFERKEQGKQQIRGAAPMVWVVCVSTDEKRLRAEVSCPEVFEGNQFEGFSKRIFVVDEDLSPTPDNIDRPDRGDDSGDVEVRVVKKK